MRANRRTASAAGFAARLLQTQALLALVESATGSSCFALLSHSDEDPGQERFVLC